MDVIDPRQFFAKDLFREADFRSGVEAYDWKQHTDKAVMIQGCSAIIPNWAFMVLTARLMPIVKSISYGEVKAPIRVHGQLGAGTPRASIS